VAHVTAEIVDKEGNFVPMADNLIQFEVKGAEIIGIESGNMRDLSSPKANERKAFNGMCLAIIQAKKSGHIIIEASSEGLVAAKIEASAY